MGGTARSGSLSSLRRANVGQVLSVLQRFGGMTQIELADATNLSAATISSIVRELADRGRVETRSISRNGRHALYVTLAQRGGLAAGVSIGGIELRVMLGDGSGEVLGKRCLPLPRLQQTDTTTIRAVELLRETIDSVGADAADLKQMTLTLPVPVDATGGVPVAEASRGWDGHEVADRFERGVGVRPVIENDAGMACIAQMRDLDLRSSHVVYVHADYEISGALCVGGTLYRGRSGLAGAFGHIQVDRNGAVCACGRRGCLNTVASASRLAELLRPSRGEVDVRDVVADAARGDLVCMRLIEDSAVQVALALEPVVTAFDPDAIVLGGMLTRAGDGFFVAFGQTLGKVVFPAGGNRRIMLGTCGDDAVARGAMMAAAGRMVMEDWRPS